jgi:poly(3-hydroxyalkanoate) synthetase
MTSYERPFNFGGRTPQYYSERQAWDRIVQSLNIEAWLSNNNEKVSGDTSWWMATKSFLQEQKVEKQVPASILYFNTTE